MAAAILDCIWQLITILYNFEQAWTILYYPKTYI